MDLYQENSRQYRLIYLNIWFSKYHMFNMFAIIVNLINMYTLELFYFFSREMGYVWKLKKCRMRMYYVQQQSIITRVVHHDSQHLDIHLISNNWYQVRVLVE